MSTNTNNERKRLNAKNPFRTIEMESAIRSPPTTMQQPQQAIKSYTVNKLSHFPLWIHLNISPSVLFFSIYEIPIE